MKDVNKHKTRCQWQRVTSLSSFCGLCTILCSVFYRQPSIRLNCCSIPIGCPIRDGPLKRAWWRHPRRIVLEETQLSLWRPPGLPHDLGASPRPWDLPVSEWEFEREAQDSWRLSSGGLFVALFLCYFEFFVVSIFVVSPFFHYSIYFWFSLKIIN